MLALTKTLKQCADVLTAVSNKTELFARDLLKALEPFKAAMGGNGNGTTDPTDAPPGSPPPAIPLYHQFLASLTSYAKQTQFSSISVKGNVARPLAAHAALFNADTNNATADYTSTRTACRTARLAVIKSRKKYKSQLKDVLSLYADIVKTSAEIDEKQDGGVTQEVKVTHNPELAVPPVPSPSRLRARTSSGDAAAPDAPVSLLNPLNFLSLESSRQRQTHSLYLALHALKGSETHYRLSVEEDCTLVHSCQQSELANLDLLQNAEGERLVAFVETMARLVATEEGSLMNMKAGLDKADMSEKNDESDCENSSNEVLKVSVWEDWKGAPL